MCGKGLAGVRGVDKSIMKLQVLETLAFEHRIQSHHLNKQWFWKFHFCSCYASILVVSSSSLSNSCHSLCCRMRLPSITAYPAK